jgi:hypothetical protein
MVLELGDLLPVDVDHGHYVAEVCETSGGGQPHIPGADDRNLAQTGPIIS